MVILPAFLIPFLLFVVPIFFIFLRSFQTETQQFTFYNYIQFFTDSVHVGAIFTTIKITIISTFAIIPIGLFIVLSVRKSRFLKHVRKIAQLSINFPSYVFAFAIIYIYGRSGIFNLLSLSLFNVELPTAGMIFSWYGIIFANILFWSAVFMSPVFAVMDMLDPNIEEAARSLGSKGFHYMKNILLPGLLPGILAGTFLVILMVFNEFGIILFLGMSKVYTLTFDLYTQMEFFKPYMASTVAVITVVSSFLISLVYKKMIRKISGAEI